MVILVWTFNLDMASFLQANDMNRKKVHYEKGDTGDLMDDLCFPVIKDVAEKDLNQNLVDLLQLLQKHVNTVTNNLQEHGTHKLPLHMDTHGLKENFEDMEMTATRFSHSYPEMLVTDLYQRMKLMCHQLELQLTCVASMGNLAKHQRRYSDVMGNRDLISNNGDDPQNKNSSMPYTKIVTPTLKHISMAPVMHGDTDFVHVPERNDRASRVFELNPYDDLVKSYKSNTDRRIKAVGNKMKCKIVIDGPFRLYDSTNACWNMRNKTAYRCSLSGITKESVDKCLKCLQDTFPQSCLNEKHMVCKSDSQHLFS